jgi:hypothetical protein
MRARQQEMEALFTCNNPSSIQHKLSSRRSTSNRFMSVGAATEAEVMVIQMSIASRFSSNSSNAYCSCDTPQSVHTTTAGVL